MVFSVQMRSQTQAEDKQLEGNQVNAFIYTLIEHQSSSDHWIALRLLKYSLLLLERHAKGKNKLPLILPLVIYNGKGKYKAPRNIYDLFTHPDLAKKALTEDYNLIDLQATDDNHIDYDKHLSFLLYTMKHIHQRDTLAMLKEAMQRCTKSIIIDKEQNYILTRLILWYTDSKLPEEKKQLLEELIVDNLPPNEASNVMRTIADAYIEEGFNKGMLQGIQQGLEQGIEKGRVEGIEKGAGQKAIEIATRMLEEKVTTKLISSVTGLDISEILKLQNKI